MKMEISVAEVVDLIKEIREQPEGLFEMIRADVKETVGQYLSELMDVELTHFLGRERYERTEGESNHRNGSYQRRFTLKGIGEVALARGAELRVGRHHQGNTPLPEFLEELEAVDDVPGQAIQAVDEDARYLAKKALECGAIKCRAGVSSVVETFFDPPPPQPLLGLEVIARDFQLGLARGEVATSIDGLTSVNGATGYRHGVFRAVQFHGFGSSKSLACAQAVGESYP
ncbi:MAG: transposase [Deltaproteobacteria bacterium]|nr:transposase [Deltaproteobacteria bacterium]